MTIPEIKEKWYEKLIVVAAYYRGSHGQNVQHIYKAEIETIKQFIADLDTLPECNGKTDHNNEVLNLLMNLSNAAGAEFEDEKMAVDLITETLKKTNGCNGVKIDYVKETCTSCGCKNHDQ